MAELQQILLGGLIGGVVGGLAGAIVTVLMMRRSASTEASAPAADPAVREERQREVKSLIDRASAVMASYGEVIDAGNAGDAAALVSSIERMRQIGTAPDEQYKDRQVAEAARAFFTFCAETQSRVDQRMASKRPDTIAGELRTRGAALAGVIEKLNTAISRYLA